MSARTVKQAARPVKSKVSLTSPVKVTPAIISGVSLEAATTVRLTFDSPVFAAKTPGYTAGAETVDSVSVVSSTEVDVVFTGSVAGATLTVPQNDGGIRNQFGGFVPAGNYAIPLT